MISFYIHEYGELLPFFFFKQKCQSNVWLSVIFSVPIFFEFWNFSLTFSEYAINVHMDFKIFEISRIYLLEKERSVNRSHYIFQH